MWKEIRRRAVPIGAGTLRITPNGDISFADDLVRALRTEYVRFFVDGRRLAIAPCNNPNLGWRIWRHSKRPRSPGRVRVATILEPLGMIPSETVTLVPTVEDGRLVVDLSEME